MTAHVHRLRPHHGPVRAPLLVRLRDGQDRWGYLTTTVSRYGSAFCSIVIYPPGTTDRERRRLRAARAWPALGLAAAGIVAVAAMMDLATTSLIVAVGVVYLLAGVVLVARSARLRRASAHATLRTSLVVSGVDDADGLDHLSAIAAVLRRADRRLDDGSLRPLEHEVVWTAAFQAVRAFGRIR